MRYAKKGIVTALIGAAALGGSLMTSPANATIDVEIDTTGTGTFNGGVGPTNIMIGSIDWNVGSALATGPGVFALGVGYQTYAHASLSQFNQSPTVGGGTKALPGGLEWTIVAGIPEMNTIFIPGVVAIQNLDPVNAANPLLNYIRIYSDTTPDASNLAGTGFQDGTLIFEARISALTSNFTNIPGVGNLDQFAGDSWSGQQSVAGIGGAQITADIAYFDPNYFKFLTTPQHIAITLYNTTQALPFSQSDPSYTFQDATGTTITATGTLGAVNGAPAPGVNFMLQTDATQSFDEALIPEPMTAGLGALSLAGLGMAAMRRRRA